MRRSNRFLAAFLLVLSLSTLAPAHPARGQQAPVRPEFGESVDVEVVNVDVVVTDKSGNRVAGLGKEDFELSVDGKPRAIDYFSAPKASPAEGSGIAAEPAPDRAIASEASVSSLLVFVDVSALEARTTTTLLDQIRAFVMTRAEAGDRVLLAAFGDTLHVLAPGTSDFETLDGAFVELSQMRGRGTRIAAERRHLEQEIRMKGQQRTSPGSSQQAVDSGALLAEIDSFADQETDRQRRLMSALRLWVSTFAGVEGRKSLLLATPGFTANPAAYLYDLADLEDRANSGEGQPRRGSLQTTEVDLYRSYEELLLQAQDARIAVYAMFPREAPPASNSPEFGSLGAAVSNLPPRDEALVEQASSLARLSGATGGSTLIIDDSLGDRMGSITDDAAFAYSLGFTTGPSAGNERHTIRVKVKREGLEVRSREAYRRHTPAERLEEALTAAAQFDLVNRAIELSIETGEAKPAKKKGTRAVPVAVRIPIGALELAPDKSGNTFKAKLDVRVAVADEKGGVHLGNSEPVEIAIPKADLERARGSAWVHRTTVELSTGTHRVAALVSEPGNGDWATVSRDVVVE